MSARAEQSSRTDARSQRPFPRACALVVHRAGAMSFARWRARSPLSGTDARPAIRARHIGVPHVKRSPASLPPSAIAWSPRRWRPANRPERRSDHRRSSSGANAFVAERCSGAPGAHDQDVAEALVRFEALDSRKRSSAGGSLSAEAGWLVNRSGCAGQSEHAKTGPPSSVRGPGEHARLSGVGGGLLGRRDGIGRREEPPRDESGFRAHGRNQRFHRLQRQAVARAQTSAPSLTDVCPAAPQILTPQGWRRKPPAKLSHKSGAPDSVCAQQKKSPCWRRGEIGRVGAPETLTGLL